MRTEDQTNELAARLDKLRFWRRACAEESPDVVVHGRQESGWNPLFFFHGDFAAGGHYVRRIAGISRQPLVSIGPHGLRGEPVPASIEAMAAARLVEIRALRPHGPYRLGGYCNGALVAYEAARLLRGEGEEVEVLILLEPSSLNVRPRYRQAHRLIGRLVAAGGGSPERRTARVGSAMLALWTAGRVAKMSGREIADLMRMLASRRITGLRRMRPWKVRGPEGTDSERALHAAQAALRSTYYRTSAAHLPEPCHVPVVALSTGLDGGGRHSDLYDAVAWAAICSRFRHIRLPGHHATCLSEGAEALATHLTEILSGQGWPDRAEPACAAPKAPASGSILTWPEGLRP